MVAGSKLSGNESKKLTLNLAIVGGGRTCKAFLELILTNPIPEIVIHISGVCDHNSEGEGLIAAKNRGIFTTDSLTELLSLPSLTGIVELTNEKYVLMEAIRQKPEGLWVISYHLAQLIMWFIRSSGVFNEGLQEVSPVRIVSDFLLQHANERIVLLAPDFTILEVTEAYLKAVNRNRKEALGKHCYEITHGFSSPCSEWDPDVACPMMETLKTGESAHAIHEHAIDGEHTTFCDLETYPIKNDAGDVVRVIEIWRDITDYLSPRWERRLKELKVDMGKLAQEDRMICLGQLSASCVHEINNPIQGLLTFSHLMKSILASGNPSREDLEQFKNYLDIMSGELERCGGIISGLLSFARESTMEIREVEINGIIRSVIALTQHKMGLQNIDLDLVLFEQPLTVKGDVNELQQCFLNLVFNAIDAMPQGGRLRITSELAEKTGNAKLTFIDTGCGIAEETLPHIFDPFFTTKGQGKGTGLGLSIVYGVVKGHGGKVRVKSRIGQGSSFILTFPCLSL